jgi:glycosyltransferase involved in cell wall biosynthesis
MSIWKRFWQFCRGKNQAGLKKEEFDAHLYLIANPDVVIQGADPWKHYVQHGRHEARPFPYKHSIGVVNEYSKYLASGYFDPEWYLAKYPDVRASGANPLQHFCEHGVWEWRDPSPYFSTSWYIDQNPDIGETNPLKHFIEHGIKEGRSPTPPRGAIRAAENTFNSICDLDPDLYAQDRLYYVKALPFVDGRLKSPKIKEALRTILWKIPAECERLIFVPWLTHSGTDVILANIVRTAHERSGPLSIAVIIADHDERKGQDWLPSETNIISFSEVDAGLTVAERSELIERLLQAVRPSSVLNINSLACWSAYRDRGRILARYSRLFTCLFCRDYNERGMPVGYSDTHFRESLPCLTGIYLDNASFCKDLERQYGLLKSDTDRFRVMKQPVTISLMDNDPRTLHHKRDKKLDVLWASRIAKQKNYKLLAEIISRAPSKYIFHIWGWGRPADVDEFKRLIDNKTNAKFHGAYPSFNSLPLHNYDAFLYTSLWDGIPNALLEAAGHGLPLIASNVGGISEVVDHGNGWLIDRVDDAAPYLAALDEIAQEPNRARAKARKMQEFLAEEHSLARYRDVICRPREFLGDA